MKSRRSKEHGGKDHRLKGLLLIRGDLDLGLCVVNERL